MQIIILAIVNNQTETHEILNFPDPIKGMQCFGIIQQIAKNRLASAVDELTREAAIMTMPEWGHGD